MLRYQFFLYTYLCITLIILKKQKGMKKKICAYAALLFTAALSFPSNVLALVSTTAPTQGSVDAVGVTVKSGIAGSGDLKSVIQGGVNFFLGLLGIIAVIVIIISGFQWMTADSEDKVKEARKRLINSVIGLIIIFAAYGIVYVVLNTVGTQFLAPASS